MGTAGRIDQQFTGSFPTTPGVWSSANPVTPLAGLWKPWVLTSAADPVGEASCIRIGCGECSIRDREESNRTNATNHLAWFWQPGFFQPWLQQLDLEIFRTTWT